MTLRPIQFVYLVVPVGLLLTALLNLYAFFHRRSDIWWTPLPKAVPVAASGDRVEIFARGTDLRTLLDAGRVRVTGDPGAGVLAADDVRIRSITGTGSAPSRRRCWCCTASRSAPPWCWWGSR